MINLTKSEFEKLEYISHGTFAEVRKKDNNIYKIYYPEVRAIYSHNMYPNPNLKYHKMKLHRLMQLNEKLKYTDLINDLIFIDGKFAGVSMPYYDGITFKNTYESSIEYRINISKQIIKNIEELVSFYIYPIDCHSKNIIIANDTVKLIDLDDINTKVKLFPNYYRYKETIWTIDTTIKLSLGENVVHDYIDITSKLTKKEEKQNNSFDEIKEYLSKKEKKYDYLIINKNTDINKYYDIINNPNYRNIFSYRLNSDYEAITKLINSGIKLYDIVRNTELNNYMHNVSYQNYIDLSDKQVLSKKKI